MNYPKIMLFFALIGFGSLINAQSAYFYLKSLNNQTSKTIYVSYINPANKQEETLAIEPGNDLPNALMIETKRSGTKIYNHPEATNNRLSNISITSENPDQMFNLLVHRETKISSPTKVPRPKRASAEIFLFDNSHQKQQYEAFWESAYQEQGTEHFYIYLTFIENHNGLIIPDRADIQVELMHQ